MSISLSTIQNGTFNSLTTLLKSREAAKTAPIAAVKTTAISTRGNRFNVDPNRPATKKQLNAIWMASKDLFEVDIVFRKDVELTHANVTSVIDIIGKRSKASDEDRLVALDHFIDSNGLTYRDLSIAANSKPAPAPAAVIVETAPATTTKKGGGGKGNPDGLAYGRYCKKAKAGNVQPLSFEGWKAASNGNKKTPITKAVVKTAAVKEAAVAQTEIAKPILSAEQKLEIVIGGLKTIFDAIA